MATIKISSFGGMAPAYDDRLLPENNAAFARNAWFYSGALQGWREPVLVYTLLSSTSESAFRIPIGSPDSAHISDSNWMEFGGSQVDVVRTAVSGDEYERYYWAQQALPPRYNTKDRIAAGQSSFLLGVPAPSFTLTVAPQIADTAESTLTETRAYAVTWVSAYGEEGPPSNPTVATGWSGGTWNISGMAAPSEPERNLVKQRIYRTVTSSQGVATYYFVVELDIADTSYADTETSGGVAANSQLESATWYPPPEDLEGWVAMPNGILAGWRGKEIWFSEAYRPHAWPTDYSLTSEYEIVGLGVHGQTLIVCTTGFPTAVTGISPASMVMAKINTFEPCTSRGSIVSAPEGVYYASPNGLICAANGSFTNVTSKLISKDKWQGLLPLQHLKAGRLGTGYYVYGVGTYGAFNPAAVDDEAFDMDEFAGSHTGLFIDPSNPVTITTFCSDAPIVNIYNDPWSGELFIIKGGGVYFVDVHDETLPMQTFLWRSKIFQSNYADNFEAMKVYFDDTELG